MCFGNTTNKTTNTTNTSTPSPWVTSAAQQNLNFAENLQNNGFSPYTGQQVANFSPQQTASFGYGQGIAGAVQPDIQLAGGALGQYINSSANGAPQVMPETISSQMSPYMNQYVNLALQPQLAQAANAYMLQNQANQGAATSAGAFGDPRANLLQSNLGLNYALENQGLVGNAYNAAFNTAIGAGAQDVATNLQGQTTNAGLQNQWLQNLLAGSNAGYSQGTGATNLLNTLGAQQTAQSQAGLNAAYNQWLMAQQYPFQTAQLLNQTIGAANPASPTTTTGTSTTSAPDNSGWGMLGSALGAVGGVALAPFTGGLSLAALGPSLSGMMGSGSAATLYPNPNGGGYAPGYAAEGGDIANPTIVGEEGPELFVPHGSGTVIPYERLQKALKEKRGVSTKNLPGPAVDAPIPQRAIGGPVGGGAVGGPVGGVPTWAFGAGRAQRPALVAPPVAPPVGSPIGPMIMGDPGMAAPGGMPGPAMPPANIFSQAPPPAAAPMPLAAPMPSQMPPRSNFGLAA